MEIFSTIITAAVITISSKKAEKVPFYLCHTIESHFANGCIFQFLTRDILWVYFEVKNFKHSKAMEKLSSCEAGRVLLL